MLLSELLSSAAVSPRLKAATKREAVVELVGLLETTEPHTHGAGLRGHDGPYRGRLAHGHYRCARPICVYEPRKRKLHRYAFKGGLDGVYSAKHL